jgi:hypothetical protein
MSDNEYEYESNGNNGGPRPSFLAEMKDLKTQVARHARMAANTNSPEEAMVATSALESIMEYAFELQSMNDSEEMAELLGEIMSLKEQAEMNAIALQSVEEQVLRKAKRESRVSANQNLKKNALNRMGEMKGKPASRKRLMTLVALNTARSKGKYHKNLMNRVEGSMYNNNMAAANANYTNAFGRFEANNLVGNIYNDVYGALQAKNEEMKQEEAIEAAPVPVAEAAAGPGILWFPGMNAIIAQTRPVAPAAPASRENVARAREARLARFGPGPKTRKQRKHRKQRKSRKY